MPQCQFIFSAIFIFQKNYTENILGIRRNKSRSSYLSDTKTESKGETEQSQEVGLSSLIGADSWIHSNCQPYLAKQLVFRYGVVCRSTGMARSNKPLSFLVNIIFLLLNNFFIRLCMSERRSNIHCVHETRVIDTTLQ
jgi:hypothetical protein